MRRRFARVGAVECSGDAWWRAGARRRAGLISTRRRRVWQRGPQGVATIRPWGQRTHCSTTVRVGHNHAPPWPCLQWLFTSCTPPPTTSTQDVSQMVFDDLPQRFALKKTC